MKYISLIIAFIILGLQSAPAQNTFKPAERVYKRTNDYIKEAFVDVEPEKNSIWVYGALRDDINDILNNAEKPPVRYRYWKAGNRTVWVLESLARTMMITTGVTVENDAIEDISVLIYRESRGAEIQNRSHRSQFYGAKLDKNNDLDKPINGISGSTLSANSMKRMGRMALVLHKAVMATED